MGHIDFLLDRFKENSEDVALVDDNLSYSFGQIFLEVVRLKKDFVEAGIEGGDAVLILGDYSFSSVSVLLALVSLKCIVIPITPTSYAGLSQSLKELSIDWRVSINGSTLEVEKCDNNVIAPELFHKLIQSDSPGLILFTSGSSGKPKAVLHDFGKLLQKFRRRRLVMVTINFLLFDHWGGLNTLLHSLSNLSTTVFPVGRKPEDICKLIEAYSIELLPVTPSFLNLLLIDGSYRRYNMSSLRLISYGAEPMPEATLMRARSAFPSVEFRQTYGMIEVGVLGSKVKSSDSTWVKIGGEGYEVRVVDGMLQIKADSAMLGYLNAPSPFTDDGFLVTGDLVLQDGEWFRILGRNSDVINVGGQKVYPAEVEAAIMGVPGVRDAIVYGLDNILLGKIVSADIQLLTALESNEEIRREIIRICREQLQPYMVPMKINFTDQSLITARLKKSRAGILSG
jgi:acyl-coenzyme A synthetase/AMP-(fatty) acid ligase